MTNKTGLEFDDSGNRKEFSSGALRDRPGGKGLYSFISPFAIKRLALRCEVGHLKYGDGRNWEKGMPFDDFVDSALRHLYQYMEGKEDEDHLAAVMWNVMCLIHLESTHPELDNLPLHKK
jgi:hypothetical protein